MAHFPSCLAVLPLPSLAPRLAPSQSLPGCPAHAGGLVWLLRGPPSCPGERTFSLSAIWQLVGPGRYFLGRSKCPKLTAQCVTPLFLADGRASLGRCVVHLTSQAHAVWVSHPSALLGQRSIPCPLETLVHVPRVPLLPWALCLPVLAGPWSHEFMGNAFQGLRLLLIGSDRVGFSRCSRFTGLCPGTSLASFFLSLSATNFRKLFWLLECLIDPTGPLILLVRMLLLTCLFTTMAILMLYTLPALL